MHQYILTSELSNFPFSVKPKFRRQINLLVRTFCLEFLPCKKVSTNFSKPCRIYKNLHYVIFSFWYISVVPMLSRVSLAFRPEFADTPDAFSEKLHSSIVAELKRLKGCSVSLFVRSFISIGTHITACTADIAHAFISWKMVTGCSVSWRAMLNGSVTLVAWNQHFGSV
jgi:hypothetical protein